MASPIRNTPTLKGKDAKRFLDEMDRERTPDEKEELRRSFESGKRLHEHFEQNSGSYKRLLAYRNAVNKIDDYFEYAFKSDDVDQIRKTVYKIIDDLTEELIKISEKDTK